MVYAFIRTLLSYIKHIPYRYMFFIKKQCILKQLCYNGSRNLCLKYFCKSVFTTKGIEMKLIQYSLTCGICLLALIVTGCHKQSAPVVNTNSGIIIHSSDFTGNIEQKVASSKARIEQISAPTAKSTGAVIHLGDGYEKIEMGPLFD